MLFLRGLTIGITMVPSRLRHPWGFYSKRIFLTLFFFFFKTLFYHCDKRQCCKGRNCTRHEEGDNKPHPGQMVSGRLVFEGCDGAFGSWSQTTTTGPDGHVSTAILCDGCVGHVLNPAQVKYQTVPQTSSIF